MMGVQVQFNCPRTQLSFCLALLPSLAPALRSRGAGQGLGPTRMIARLGAHARPPVMADMGGSAGSKGAREHACPCAGRRAKSDRRPEPPRAEALAPRHDATVLGHVPPSRRSGDCFSPCVLTPPLWAW